jgi:phenylacetate-CoA ligase
MTLLLRRTRGEIEGIQCERKRFAFTQAKSAPFYVGRLDHVNPDRLDDPEEWQKIPVLTKDELRAIPDEMYYRDFCLEPHDGVQEYWRSGGATGKPFFYPRSYSDIYWAIISFARTLDCIGHKRGARAHISFPLGIHPVGQVFGRCTEQVGIAKLSGDRIALEGFLGLFGAQSAGQGLAAGADP